MSSAGSGSRALVDAYEGSVAHETRRADGVHYTPHAVARQLVELGVEALGSTPQSICDPTCGAGAFLLAAADALAERGVDPVEIVDERLFGVEVDPAAAEVARSALRRWAEDRGARGSTHPRVAVADTLVARPADAGPVGGDGGASVGPVDLIVGNPPFLNQLARRTARDAQVRGAVSRRFGPLGTYADSASLFLLGALDLVRPGGVVVMVQPQSFLAARDTASVRAQLLARSELVMVWSTDAELFDAAVHVCAPVLRVGGTGGAGPVRVLWTSDPGAPAASECSQEPSPGGDDSWGPLFATSRGLPRVRVHGGARVGSIATATAGFRDEFYALSDASIDLGEHHHEHDDRMTDDETTDRRRRLVTVGMIDPGRASWGERARRFGGRSQLAPMVDLDHLSTSAPRVARWVAGRLVPKVLVATQTRIVEAVADPTGSWVPVTPTISVEPIPVDLSASAVSERVWLLAAALLAPPVSARALSQHLGAGLSPGALRWSARSVLDVELPSEHRSWAEGSTLVQQLAASAPSERPDLLARLGATMCAAHQIDTDDPVFDWWLERALRASR